MENTTISHYNNKIKALNEGVAGVKGHHILTVSDMRSNEAQGLEIEIQKIINERQRLLEARQLTPTIGHYLWLEYRRLLSILHDKFAVRQAIVDNLTTDVGRSVLMARLSGTVTYTGIANYCALGTSAAAVTVADVQLGTEVFRKTIVGTFASNIAYLESFFSSVDVNGTFEEYGFFIDGAAGANTGVIFNHFTSHVVKSNVESLNVQSTITLNSV